MNRYQGFERATAEMLGEAAKYLKVAAGLAVACGVDSPAADYIVEIDERARQVADMVAQFRQEVVNR